MFFLRLLVLPFRGLWLMIWGLITSLPIWIIVGLCYLNVWAPLAFEFFTERSSGFVCSLDSTNINPFKGEFLLQNLSITNPRQYATSDFLRVNKIEVQSSVAQWFSSYRHYYKIEIDVQKLTWALNSFTDNNIQKFIESFLDPKIIEKQPEAITGKSDKPEQNKGATDNTSTANKAKELKNISDENKGKGFFIKQLVLRFNGNISIQDFSSGILRAKDYPISYEKTYNNIAHKLTEGQKLALGETEYIPYEDVLKEVTKTFKEGYGFSFLVNSILSSLSKYPCLTPMVQKLF